MARLLIIPILVVLLMVQMAVISHLPLVHGTADLILLVVISWSLQEKTKSAWLLAGFSGLVMDYVSAMPLGVFTVSYLAVVGLASLLQNRVWQTPILSLIFMTVIGSLFSAVLSFVLLFLQGISLPLYESLTQVILPGLLLNLLLVLPVYLIMTDVVSWMYPAKDLV
jgi:rod shape-determining protein MreD